MYQIQEANAICEEKKRRSRMVIHQHDDDDRCIISNNNLSTSRSTQIQHNKIRIPVGNNNRSDI